MIKKHIEFVDYDDAPTAGDYWFNLNKGELAKLNFSFKGGLEETFKQISSEQDTGKTLDLFEKIILMSYGIRGANGKSFRKDPEATDEFRWSMAYDALFMELINDPEAAIAFIRGVIPKDLAAEAEKRNAFQIPAEVAADVK